MQIRNPCGFDGAGYIQKYWTHIQGRGSDLIFKKINLVKIFENGFKQIFCLVIKIMLHLFKIYLFI